MRCPECGWNNDDGQKICIKCGTKLSEAKKPEPKVQKVENKTVKGGIAGTPAWDAENNPVIGHKEMGTTSLKCPQCGHYPLAISVKEAPCPNCGHDEEKNEGKNPVSSFHIPSPGQQPASQRPKSDTLDINSLNIGNKDQFKLVDSKNGKIFEFKGDKVIVRRDNIDADNKSISSKSHAVFSFQDGQLVVEDQSSNGATFVQTSGEVKVHPGSMIILGNKIYTVEY